MNTRQKMYETNKRIKNFLSKNGFSYIYLFPHLRYLKDYNLKGYGFDALGFKKINSGHKPCLFQFKSNKKPSKKILEAYRKISKSHNVYLYWINCPNRKKIELYC